MKKQGTFKNVVLGLSTAVIGLSGQAAFAHTTFRNANTILENVVDYDFVQTSHGCFENAARTVRIPVKGVSAVFGTDADAIVETYLSSANTPTGTLTRGTPAKLSDFFTSRDHTGAVSALVSIGSVLTNMESHEVFPKNRRKVDPLGNTVGFESWGGKLDPFSTGAFPVRLGGISFNPASCATKLVIRVAIADVCKPGAFPPGEGKANVWINHVTTKFKNSNVDGIAPVDATGKAVPANFWPTISIKRNLTTNPLPANCNASNTFDVFNTPSDNQIDRDLPIQGWWGK